VSEGLDALDHLLRPAAGQPDGAIVLFHGRGVDERDLYPLLDELDPDRRLVGATPRAPLALPPDPGAHWYVVRQLGYPDRETFDASFGLASRWLEALSEVSGVPPEQTVLGGFSQGAVMTYALGLAAGRPRPAGVMALSGFIPTVEGLSLDLESRRGLPVAIAHGSLDPVIGVEFGREARERLQAAGLDVTYRESPIGHGVDPRLLPDLSLWLAERLPAGAPPAS
jgi:phospholipase/carboxylesterase